MRRRDATRFLKSARRDLADANRGVNAPGEDAMKLQKILFSFDGRIGRRTYWLAIIALIAAVQLMTIGLLLDNEMVGRINASS